MRWLRLNRPHITLLVLFTAMAAVSPTLDATEVALLFALAAVEIAEPKIPFFASPRGRIVWIVLQLLLAYLLIGKTGGLISHYFLILLVPVVSAATYLGVAGTLIFTLLACASYLSFLLFIDFSRYFIDPEEVRAMVVRLVLLTVVGNLVNTLA